jgi:hypothetical protein
MRISGPTPDKHGTKGHDHNAKTGENPAEDKARARSHSARFVPNVKKQEQECEAAGNNTGDEAEQHASDDSTGDSGHLRNCSFGNSLS